MLYYTAGMPVYTVRLDESSEEALAAAAHARQVSRAVILREAIAQYAGAAVREASPLHRLSPLIGVIENGPKELSEHTGRGLARLLAARSAKARTGRPAGRSRSKTTKA